jgi:hypothetical protein
MTRALLVSTLSFFTISLADAAPRTENPETELAIAMKFLRLNGVVARAVGDWKAAQNGKTGEIWNGPEPRVSVSGWQRGEEAKNFTITVGGAETSPQQGREPASITSQVKLPPQVLARMWQKMANAAPALPAGGLDLEFLNATGKIASAVARWKARWEVRNRKTWAGPDPQIVAAKRVYTGSLEMPFELTMLLPGATHPERTKLKTTLDVYQSKALHELGSAMIAADVKRRGLKAQHSPPAAASKVEPKKPTTKKRSWLKARPGWGGRRFPGPHRSSRRK